MTVRMAGFLVVILIGLRAVMAAALPLSADEAYYLLWSHHLAAGYYDHPPAIAFLIRAGTFLFGDTPLGARASGIVASVLASWFVWQSALLILKDETKAAWAALFFNLALMTNVELLAATPDQPSIVTVAAFVWCLARLQQSGDGRWWLAAGLAAGLSLLSKYSMLFMGLGSLVWLLLDPRMRPWLLRPWPYLGGALALAVFAPNLYWQARHHWMTFAFQFGRIGQGGITGRYLVEFTGAQLGLATPLIFVLAALGFWRARKPGEDRFLLAALVGTALAYFLFHALRDRVQGNWPCFLYGALAILAADALASAPRWLARAAAPLAAVLLLAVYAQAAFAPIPWRGDPAARLLARGFPAVAQEVAETGAVLLTTDYETTALLRLARPGLTVIQVNDGFRYPDSPAPAPALLRGPLVYLAEQRRARPDILAGLFARQEPPQTITPAQGPAYVMIRVSGPRQPSFGRMP